MKKWIALTLLLCSCQGSVSTFESEIKNSDGIVGGTVVPFENSLTFKVLSLRLMHVAKIETVGNTTTTYYQGTRCTSSALTRTIILTAAHCVFKPDEIMRIELPTENGEKVYYNVADIKVHPDYKPIVEGVPVVVNPDEINSDIALLKLETPLPEQVHLMQLPAKSVDLALRTLTAAGFGRTSGVKNAVEDGGTLRTVTVDVLSYSPTKSVLKIDQSKGKGFCQGDSGGPAMTDINGQTTVVGVAAQTESPENPTDNCAHKGVYVNIQFHLDWILKTIKELSPSSALLE